MSTTPLLLLDGATGTELDRRGVDIGMPLWSAQAIFNAPDVLKEVHASYLKAGADAIITNTFRTHQRSLAKVGMGDRAEELTHQAVSIACDARDAVKPEAMVLGSIAPLEDCYRPELTPDANICRHEHTQIIRHLIDGGVDLVLIETMCEAGEALAAAAAAATEAPEQWAISFCLAPSGEPGVLLDGAHLGDLVPHLTGARFIGINCVPATQMREQVQHLRSLLPDTMPIAAYGNVGYADEEGGWISTDAVEPHRYAAYAMDWIDAGASIVGGCCGTTPQTITAIASCLH
ncbi:MAG: homocysteine S-methyltransferase family protein [Phycisphaerales bacterium]|jgi:S-methylmethionine-dependent homocysteine/selenocysteine methylase|nr:homocysteine S-methyltransferase family protein [Phycisphaerales bacterium]